MSMGELLDRFLMWLADHGVVAAIIIVLALVALKAAALLNRKLPALFRVKDDTESRELSEAMVRGANWITSVLILGMAAVALLSLTGVSTGPVVGKLIDWLVLNGVGIVITVAITFVALKLAGILTGKLLTLLQRDKHDTESQKRTETLSSVVRWLLRTVILVVASVTILGQFGVQIGPIIAAAGVVGLAVGFGAQHLVQDFIAGFFFLLEDQLRSGDVVQLNDKRGVVEKMTLRMVVLRDFAGNVHYVRNGKIDVVTNMTKDYSRAVFDVGVAYREDYDEVCAVMNAVAAALQQDPEFKNDILEPLEIAGLDRFADSAVVIKARIKTRPNQQWRITREYNRRLKKKFDEVGIEIPFPHLTLYPGKDKQGGSPTLKIEVEGRAGLPPS